ncbi:MAG TPA: CPBP family intramembrane glutamic endopeptidase [Allosphingosinicella sp.]|nr:CPBP family intramembrane glutamic endopeptidase [Allosphingosinicella sp.]
MTQAKRAASCWLAYALLWAASVAYLAARGADWVFPIASLLLFGGLASGIAWALTRRSAAPQVPVARPPVELAAVLAYLLLYAFLFLGPGMNALRAAAPPGPAQDLIVLAVKLIVHVALPAGLLLLLGARLRPLFDSGLGRRGFWPVLLVLGPLFLVLLSIVSPSLANIAALHPPVITLLWAAPLSYIWISLEAGLCEEFLYRAVLQSRVAAVIRSAWGAIPVASLIFALAHAPGLYLRGGPGVDGWSADPLQVAAFTIATLSPVGLFFGTLWWRTRSLLLVVLLHGAIDVLPNLPEFLRHFAL